MIFDRCFCTCRATLCDLECVNCVLRAALFYSGYVKTIIAMGIAIGMLVTQITLFFVLFSNAIHSLMRAKLSCYPSFTMYIVKHWHTLIKIVKIQTTVVGWIPFAKLKMLFTLHTN